MKAKLVIEFEKWDLFVSALKKASENMDDETYQKIKVLNPDLIILFHQLKTVEQEMRQYAD